jgi:hypothetical protein
MEKDNVRNIFSMNMLRLMFGWNIPETDKLNKLLVNALRNDDHIRELSESLGSPYEVTQNAILSLRDILKRKAEAQGVSMEDVMESTVK